MFLWLISLISHLKAWITQSCALTYSCLLLYHVFFFLTNTLLSKQTCRNCSCIINGNRMHLSTNLSVIAKGWNNYQVDISGILLMVNKFSKIMCIFTGTAVVIGRALIVNNNTDFRGKTFFFCTVLQRFKMYLLVLYMAVDLEWN